LIQLLVFLYEGIFGSKTLNYCDWPLY